MIKYYFLLLLCAFSLFGLSCSKPDPNPELKDPIYRDIEEKVKEVTSLVETEKKNLDEAKAKMTAAAPQTGQIKYASKKYYETKKRLEKLEQLLRFYKIKLESRKYEAQDQYLDAYEKGTHEKWPNPNDFEDYKTQEDARTKKRNWSVKKRIEEEMSGVTDNNAKAPGKGSGSKAGGH